MLLRLFLDAYSQVPTYDYEASMHDQVGSWQCINNQVVDGNVHAIIDIFTESIKLKRTLSSACSIV